jgi:hypothetical protein
MILNQLLFVILPAVAPLLPDHADNDGWGLRLHNLSAPGPYLVGESIGRVTFGVTLISFSKETRKHDPLFVANALGDLRVIVFNSDQEAIDNVGLRRLAKRDPLTEPIELRPGDFSCNEFSFGSFGYYKVRDLGKHRVQATMKIGQREKGTSYFFLPPLLRLGVHSHRVSQINSTLLTSLPPRWP